MRPFSFKIFIPSIQREVRFNEMSNAEYKTLIKATQNNDDELIESIVDDMCQEKCTERGLIFDKFDKFVIMLEIFSLCAKNIVTLIFTEGETRSNVSIDIHAHVSKYLGIVTRFEHDIGFATLVCGPSLKLSDVDNSHIIHSIKIGNSISIVDASQNEEILASLPVDVFREIMQKFNEMNARISKIETFKNAMNVRLNDMSLYHVMKTLINGSLSEIYGLEYVLATKCNLSINEQERMTPVETQVLFSLYKEEMEEKSKREQNSNQRN